ncbi:MAG: tRNA (adenosine(37)-N6)-threonylcarbamoyltransferase complex ATPase subunit type 1 TsaE [Sarcina sp.]|nr:tRNA (adenosine(37)-N6)-threonylcarbamoyltransferase complex ATPase subunit type 1 TsaE [Sarcina sp.]
MDAVTKIYESHSPDETLEIGRRMGEGARAGEVYALVGDLGVGKTVFTKGFAEGLGIDEAVNSPTFTILQIYEEGRLPLYHFDVYRIEEPEEMEEIGLDEYLDGDGVCLIEWAGRIADLLPEDVIIIRIEKDLEKGLDYRRITQIRRNCD